MRDERRFTRAERVCGAEWFATCRHILRGTIQHSGLVAALLSLAHNFRAFGSSLCLKVLPKKESSNHPSIRVYTKKLKLNLKDFELDIISLPLFHLLIPEFLADTIKRVYICEQNKRCQTHMYCIIASECVR